MEKQALLAGATGLVGSRLLPLLCESGRYARVHVLLRRDMRYDRPEIVEHVLDFADLGSWTPPRFDDLFCCLGTTMRKAGSKEAFRRVDLGFVTTLGRMANLSGASMFLISSVGASPKAASFYLRTKGEAEKALETLALPRLGILRPALMHAGRRESRPGEKLAGVFMGLVSPLMLGGLRRYRPIHPERVARAMLNLAMRDFNGIVTLESEEIADLGLQ